MGSLKKLLFPSAFSLFLAALFIAVCGLSSCSLPACRLSCPEACEILVPQSGIELTSLALEGGLLFFRRRTLNQLTAGEVPPYILMEKMKHCPYTVATVEKILTSKLFMEPRLNVTHVSTGNVALSKKRRRLQSWGHGCPLRAVSGFLSSEQLRRTSNLVSFYFLLVVSSSFLRPWV